MSDREEEDRLKRIYKRVMRIVMLLLMPGMITVPMISEGRDLGRFGNVFKVVEEGFSEMMKRRLGEVDMKKYEQEFEGVVRSRVKEPKPVEKIQRADESREWLFDPSYEVDEDVILPCGKILHKAGTRVNPLDYMSLERRIIFIDGRDEKQKKWLRELLGARDEKKEKNDGEESRGSGIEDRIILVGGSVFEMREEFGEMVYFDQFGELTGKFGIRAVPAIALQDGILIKIEEVGL